jgi:exonuclease VII small subunit
MDQYCELKGELEDPYSCTLYKVKDTVIHFYTIQLVKCEETYSVYIRHGVEGEKGKIKVTNDLSKEDAVKQFEKQFTTKTDNTFGKKFKKKEDKYDDKYPDDFADKSKELSKKLVEPKLIYFLNLISDEAIIENALKQLHIDTTRMPVGKITIQRIEKAEEILNKLKAKFNTNKKNNSEIDDTKLDDNDVAQMTSDYYMYIPYNVDSSKSNPPLLNNNSTIDNYMANMEIIKHIVVTYTSIIKNKRKVAIINKLENIYNNLGSDIAPLDESTQMYKELEKYVANSHGSTHGRNLKLVHVYEVNNKAQNKVYEKHTKNMQNKTLLFHGSAISNWFSILRNGFFLDPARVGVKITGKMFGHGIYWANSVTKSYNYCSAYGTGTAIMAVGEIALGNMHKPASANYSLGQAEMDSLKTNSTQGRGQYTPSSETTIDGVIVPNGPLHHAGNHCGLMYDEFIIYNTNQYRIRYLIVLSP